METELTFTIEDGINCRHEITVYALSTCGFCRRGLEFLKNNSIRFRFIYLDQLPADVKNKIKDDLEKKFTKRVNFPYIIINNEKVLVGFTEDIWRMELL